MLDAGRWMLDAGCWKLEVRMGEERSQGDRSIAVPAL